MGFSKKKMKHGFRDLIMGKPKSPEEKQAYEKAYKKARIQRAKREGRKAGLSDKGKWQGRMEGIGRVASTLVLDDPFTAPTRRASKPRSTRKSKTTTIKVNGHTIRISGTRKKRKRKPKQQDPIWMF